VDNLDEDIKKEIQFYQHAFKNQTQLYKGQGVLQEPKLVFNAMEEDNSNHQLIKNYIDECLSDINYNT
jgi:hypothetical protein